MTFCDKKTTIMMKRKQEISSKINNDTIKKNLIIIVFTKYPFTFTQSNVALLLDLVDL